MNPYIYTWLNELERAGTLFTLEQGEAVLVTWSTKKAETDMANQCMMRVFYEDIVMALSLRDIYRRQQSGDGVRVV